MQHKMPGSGRMCSGTLGRRRGITGLEAALVKKMLAVSKKANCFSGTHPFHFVQLLLDRTQPLPSLSVVHLASGEALPCSIDRVVNILVSFQLSVHAVLLLSLSSFPAWRSARSLTAINF